MAFIRPRFRFTRTLKLCLYAKNITGNSYDALSGYQYVVLHFGNGQAGGVRADIIRRGIWEVMEAH